MCETKKTVLVDLDGVLCEYDGWKGVEHFGEPIPGAREFLSYLRERFEVAIYTTRCNVRVNDPDPLTDDPEAKFSFLVGLVRQWLAQHDMPYDRVVIGKPLAVAIIDDRAISCRPQDRLGPKVAYWKALGDLRRLAEDQEAQGD